MRTTSLLLAALLLLPAVGAQTDPSELSVGAASLRVVDPNVAPGSSGYEVAADASSLDLVEHHGLALEISVPVEDDQEALAVTAQLFHEDATAPTIEFALQKGAEIEGHPGEDPSDDATVDGCNPAKFCNWIGTVLVDAPALVAGTWTVKAVALDGSGNQVATAEAQEVTFDVGVANDGDHPLSLSLLSAECATSGSDIDPLHVASGQTLQAAPSVTGAEYLIKHVSFSVQHAQDDPDKTVDDYLSREETTLAAPYLLAGTLFEDGRQTLMLKAEDRLGRMQTCDVDLLVDTRAPLVVAALAAGTFGHDKHQPSAYQGVPFNVTALVNETSDYTLRVVIGDQEVLQDQEDAEAVDDAIPSLGLHTLEFTLDTLGYHDVFISTRDAFDNTHAFGLNVTVVAAITDSSISLERLGAVPLAGDEVTFEATAHQTGVKSLEFMVTYLAEDDTQPPVHAVVVPKEGSTVVPTYADTFPIGEHMMEAHIQAPDGINETDDSNQYANVTFEVFVAQIIYNGTDYYVRGDSRGLPCYLVSDVNSKSSGPCDLVRRDVNLTSVVYDFTLMDNDLTWDPEDREPGGRPVYDLGDAPDKSASKNKDSPGLWVGLLVLGLLGAAARRRR